MNLGPMAQDFHRLFGLGTKTGIQIRDLAALALVAAQELDRDGKSKHERIEALENEVSELKEMVARLASER